MNPRTLDRLARLIRWSLGALLLAAAALKAHDLATGPLVGEGIWANRWLMALLVEAEAALGLWLLSGLFPVLAVYVTAACFLLYAGFAISKALSGAHSCGCFGRVPVNPWITLALDLVAAPAAFCAGRFSAPLRRQITLRRALLWSTLCLALAVPSFLKMTVYHAAPRSDLQLTVLDSRQWVGQSWPLGAYVDAWDKLSRGRWAVLLYSWPCGHCAGTVKAYAELASDWAARGTAEKVALVETGDPPPETVQSLLQSSPALQSRLSAPAEWFITSPTVVVLQDGRVVAVAEGDEDCAWDPARLGRW